MGVTLSNASAALKVRYSDHLTRILDEDPMNRVNSFMGLVTRKKGNVMKGAMGLNFTQPIKVRGPQTARYDFAKAQSKSDGATGQSKYHNWVIPCVPGYSTARVDGQAQAVGDGGANSFVDLLAEETDAALLEAQREIAQAAFKSGTGSRARIAAVNHTPDYIDVAAADTVRFEIDMELVAAAADGTGSLRSATALRITGINPVTGRMTLSGDPTALSWSAGSGGDYLYQDGDFLASTKTKIVGFESWNPVTVPTAGSGDFLGILEADRIANWKFYGLREDATSAGSFKQALINASAKVATFAKGITTHAFCNPLDFATLVGGLDSQKHLVQVEGKYGLSYDGFKVYGASGTFPLLPDANVPRGVARLMNLDKVTLLHAGSDIVDIIKEDDNIVLRKGDADSFEVRVRSMANMLCENPSELCVIYNVT